MSAFFLVVPLLLSADPAVSEWTSAVAAIRAVDQFGRGHAEAVRAWPRVTELPAERLAELLSAFDGANPLAANWLRAAGEAIIQRDGLHQVPPAVLRDWVLDRRHDARGRHRVNRRGHVMHPIGKSDIGNGARLENQRQFVFADRNAELDIVVARAIHKKRGRLRNPRDDAGNERASHGEIGRAHV